MKINIAIIEDSHADSSLLKEYLEKYTKDTKFEVTIDIYESSSEFLFKYVGQYEVIFFDIELHENELNGIEAAKSVRKIDSNCEIVFVTNLGRYAIEGYQVRALDFILKPITYESFSFRIEKIFSKFANTQEKRLKIKSKGLYYNIAVDDIIYIEINNHSCVFYGYFENNGVISSVETWSSMKAVEETIKGPNFVRCNNSTLVNLKFVTKIEKENIFLGNIKLSISRNRKKSFIDAYLSNFGG